MTDAKIKAAFLGLGVMGFPMAGHLATAGYPVTVYNRTSAKARDWCARHSGEPAATPKSAAAEADFVFMCLGNDDDLRSVVYGPDGVLAGLRPGSVLIDHTTASADIAREFADACAQQRADFLDAPVSGGQAGAENGALTIMVGGSEAAFSRAAPAMQCFGKAVTRLGDTGAGQMTKMVNQIAIAGLLQGLSEALAFGQRAGLDMETVLSVIGQGAAQSWQMDNRGQTMLAGMFDFGFAVDWVRKDLSICLEEARRNGAHLPVTALVDQFYGQVQEAGGGRWDTSSLIHLLK